MKITRIEAIPYSPPLRKFFGREVKLGFGELKNLDYGLVRVHTDAGLMGFGEISSVFAPTGTELCRIATNVIAPHLVGSDPTHIAKAHHLMDVAIERAEPVKAAIDMALDDILGKSLGVPVHALLGGQVREKIALSFSIMFGNSEEMAGLASELAEHGYSTVKVKVGQGIEEDEDAVRAIRAAVGMQVTVRVDANMAWKTPKEALTSLRRIEPYDIELAEQPLASEDLDGMAFIREHIDIPIMADESVWSPRTAMSVLQRQAADIVSVYVAEAGGLFRAAKIFSMCEAARIPCAIGSMPRPASAPRPRCCEAALPCSSNRARCSRRLLLRTRSSGWGFARCFLRFIYGTAVSPSMLSRRWPAKVSLGADGAFDFPPGDTIRAARLMSQAYADPFSPEALLEMHTVNAAGAAGLEAELGSLEPGKRADLVIRDPNAAEAYPDNNLCHVLALTLGPGSVRTVLVDGRVVFDDGHPTQVEERNVYREVSRSVLERARRLGIDPGPEWPVMG